MILDALVFTPSYNTNPPLPFWHQLYFIHDWYMPCLYVSHASPVSGVKNLADDVVRLLWGELLGFRRGVGHARAPCLRLLDDQFPALSVPLLLPFGAIAHSDNALPNYKFKFCGGFSGTAISFNGWMASPLQVPKRNWTGCPATNKSDSLVCRPWW